MTGPPARFAKPSPGTTAPADIDPLLAYPAGLTDRSFIENPDPAYPDDPCGSR